jgi:hypothetical protein
MTVNDLDKVDEALKNRPSRFKYVKHFANPSLETRMKLLPLDVAKSTEGCSLDQVFKAKESYEKAIVERSKNI